eukprot:Gb_20151 [translate_table: standard]
MVGEANFLTTDKGSSRVYPYTPICKQAAPHYPWMKSGGGLRGPIAGSKTLETPCASHPNMGVAAPFIGRVAVTLAAAYSFESIMQNYYSHKSSQNPNNSRIEREQRQLKEMGMASTVPKFAPEFDGLHCFETFKLSPSRSQNAC